MSEVTTETLDTVNAALDNAPVDRDVSEEMEATTKKIYDKLPERLLKRCLRMYHQYIDTCGDEFEDGGGLQMAFGRARFQSNNSQSNFRMFRHVETREPPVFSRPLVKFLQEVYGFRPGDADLFAGRVLDKYIADNS